MYHLIEMQRCGDEYIPGSIIAAVDSFYEAQETAPLLTSTDSPHIGILSLDTYLIEEII